MDDTFYKVPVTDEFIAVLQKNEWLKNNRKKTEASFYENITWITIHMSEAYEFYIYSDSNASVSAFDGYADIGEASSSYFITKGSLFDFARNDIITNGSVEGLKNGVNKIFLK